VNASELDQHGEPQRRLIVQEQRAMHLKALRLTYQAKNENKKKQTKKERKKVRKVTW
jgi:hypothetical protein